MNFSDQLLSALVAYGIPLLFAVVLIASAGVPFPVSLMLVAAGSFAKQGTLPLVATIIAGSSAAILGDQLAFGVARSGGRRVVSRFTRRFGGAEKIKRAEALTNRWGGAGIFFSRWLITALGPWINISSGLSDYPWRKFLLWDIAGEIVWVTLYILLGYFFSDRVQYIAQILGNLGWTILALAVAVYLGWKLIHHAKAEPAG